MDTWDSRCCAAVVRIRAFMAHVMYDIARTGPTSFSNLTGSRIDPLLSTVEITPHPNHIVEFTSSPIRTTRKKPNSTRTNPYRKAQVFPFRPWTAHKPAGVSMIARHEVIYLLRQRLAVPLNNLLPVLHFDASRYRVRKGTCTKGRCIFIYNITLFLDTDYTPDIFWTGPSIISIIARSRRFPFRLRGMRF